MRGQYQPERVRLIFIGESPPTDLKGYVYNAEGRRDLSNQLAHIVFRHTGFAKRPKDETLRALASAGVLFLDASDVAVDRLPKGPARNAAVAEPLSKLLEVLAQHRGVPVVILQDNVFEVLGGPLRAAGHRVIHDVPLKPLWQGWQAVSRSQIGEALDAIGWHAEHMPAALMEERVPSAAVPSEPQTSLSEGVQRPTAQQRRAARLAKLPPLPAYMGDMEPVQLMLEARACYVEGYFMATVLAACAHVEHTLVEELQARGIVAQNKSPPFEVAIQLAAGIFSDADTVKRLDRLRQVRNPLTHRKSADHEHTIANRFRKGKHERHPQAILEEDATLAVDLMHGLFFATLQQINENDDA